MTVDNIENLFNQLTGFPPRRFQVDTIDKLLKFDNSLLRAPTGSGKTETAIAPFLFARHRQMEIQDFRHWFRTWDVRTLIEKGL